MESISFVIVSKLKRQDLKLDVPMSEAQDLPLLEKFLSREQLLPSA